MARMTGALRASQLVGKGQVRESKIAAVLTDVLKEVDPQVDPGHIAHLPAEKSQSLAERRAGKTGPVRWRKSRRG
jgi:hypothetical protein